MNPDIEPQAYEYGVFFDRQKQSTVVWTDDFGYAEHVFLRDRDGAHAAQIIRHGAKGGGLVKRRSKG
jgi:hypothetical protein